MAGEEAPLHQIEVSGDLTPFDSLAQFLEERDDRTEAEVTQAIEVAIQTVLQYPEEDWDVHMGEIIGIAINYGINPDTVLAMYASLESYID